MQHTRKLGVAMVIGVFLAGTLLMSGACQPWGGDNETDVWSGDEQITVRYDDDEVVIDLEGMELSSYEDIEGILLRDIVKAAAVVDSPKDYYYNLIAGTDGFSFKQMVEAGRGEGLPSWDDMKQGFLYDAGADGLKAFWEPGSMPGDFQGGTSFYAISGMQDGVIELYDTDLQ